jgi:hypothetical protein
MCAYAAMQAGGVLKVASVVSATPVAHRPDASAVVHQPGSCEHVCGAAAATAASQPAPLGCVIIAALRASLLDTTTAQHLQPRLACEVLTAAAAAAPLAEMANMLHADAAELLFEVLRSCAMRSCAVALPLHNRGQHSEAGGLGRAGVLQGCADISATQADEDCLLLAAIHALTSLAGAGALPSEVPMPALFTHTHTHSQQCP